MTEAQVAAITRLQTNYKVEPDLTGFHPAFDLPTGWVIGWIGDKIYVGVSPEGDIHS